MLKPITVIIDDDCKTFCHSLAATLTAAGIKVVATVNNGEDLITQVKLHRTHIVFIDIRMPVTDGITACLELVRLYPEIGKIAIQPCLVIS